MRQKFITKCVRFFITKCDNFITKWDSYYKMRRLLQIATVQCLINSKEGVGLFRISQKERLLSSLITTEGILELSHDVPPLPPSRKRASSPLKFG